MVSAIQKKLEIPGSKIILAFASVYLIWGSTYLAIRFAIETIPTFFMGGVRFLTAGFIVYLFLRLRGREKPSMSEWRTESIVGLLLLAIANGSVVMAEHTVPSGLAALMVATVSVWMVLLNWLWKGAHHNKSLMLSAAMQMITGGVFLMIFATINGEWQTLNLSGISLLSFYSLGYLIVFGSIIGFSSYVYILRHSSPDHVSTYAYVNPVIAVILGWAFADEIIDLKIIIAAGFIIFSVILITKFREGKNITTEVTSVKKKVIVENR